MLSQRTTRGRADDRTAISVMNPDGTNVKRIFSEEGGMALSPQWSPDGRWIAFGAGAFFVERDKPARVMMVRDDGTEVRPLTTGPANAGFPSWSPDGKHVVYRVWGETAEGLRIVGLEDRVVRTLTSGYDNFPSWSPTGERIAFTRLANDNFDIYSIRPDGTDLKQLTNAPGNDAHSAW